MSKKTKIIALVIVLIFVVSIAGLTLKRNKDVVEDVSIEAKEFSLPATDGKQVSLSEFRGKKNVLLYFHEGLMCEPCWAQMVDFEKRIGEFDKLGVEILTVTVDPLQETIKYLGETGIGLKVLADADKAVSNMYDVLKDSMHPGEFPGHTFFLVDKKGIVIWKYVAYKNFKGAMYVDVNFVIGNVKKALSDDEGV